MYALGLPARATVPRRNVCASAQVRMASRAGTAVVWAPID